VTIYVGGRGADEVHAVTFDPGGELWIAGHTSAGERPLTDPRLRLLVEKLDLGRGAPRR
jgi:hypothetical protein